MRAENQDLPASSRALSSSDDEVQYENAEVLRAAVILYGSLFVAVMIVFGWVRRRFPRAFNLRNWVESIKTPVAEEQFGYFSWMWEVYRIDEDTLMDACGMDAVCFLQVIRTGVRMSVVNLFIMVWLLPVYYTAEDSSQTEISDPVVQTTISNVPTGDSRFTATVIAAYISFGYAMYTILQDFQWYIAMRHKYLRKPLARHYAIFVRNIPPHFRNNGGLAAFFRSFSPDAVLEAHICISSSNLERAIAEREVTLARLEHALALYQRDEVRPTHKKKMLARSEDNVVDSIDFYSTLLEEQNKSVSDQIAALKAIVDSPIVSGTQSLIAMPTFSSVNDNGDDDAPSVLLSDEGLSKPLYDTTSGGAVPDEVEKPAETIGKNDGDGDKHDDDHDDDDMSEGESFLLKMFSATAGSVESSIKHTYSAAKSVTKTATNTAASFATKTIETIEGKVEDGTVCSAGFVVFSKLSTVNAAMQIVHHSTPFTMQVIEAADPRFVIWENVGRTHKDLQAGKVTSIALSATLILVATIPTSFIASLSNADSIRTELPHMDDAFNKNPWLLTAVEQLAPLLLVFMNQINRLIFEWFTVFFEGHVSPGIVETSKFVKIALYMIIQTFFVSVISGGIFQALSEIINNPSSIVSYLANTLPAQATYFKQILIVYTVQNAFFDLLRIFPLIFAGLRGCVGPRLTEKERNSRFIGLRPLSDPFKFGEAYFWSVLVLFYMIMFVYSVISPMTAIFTFICFLFMGSMYRYLFVFVYPKEPDSGGKLWGAFVNFMLTCMFVAEVTILGLLSLKKAPIQVGLLIPLPCITLLFNLYIRQMHFTVASYLPTRECLKEDLRRSENFDFSFVRGVFTQPALAAKPEVHPDPSLEPLSTTTDVDA